MNVAVWGLRACATDNALFHTVPARLMLVMQPRHAMAVIHARLYQYHARSAGFMGGGSYGEMPVLGLSILSAHPATKD